MDIVMDKVSEKQSTTPLSQYESQMQKYRKQIPQTVTDYLADTNPRTVLLFWIYFSANGVGMTEPVDVWLDGASKSCEKHGYTQLAKQLAKHIVHESGHHVMMIEDLEKLVNKWNTLYTPKLDAKELLNTPPTKPVIAYRELHEKYINSDRPYCQIAIEYEIESLSLNYDVVKIVDHAVQVLGDEIIECLSFLEDHMRIDIGHTEFNRKELSNFLDAYPHAVNDLVVTGAESLNVYGQFLKNCYKQALAM